MRYELASFGPLQGDGSHPLGRTYFLMSFYENNQQGALYRSIYYSKSAVHFSGDVLAHH